MPPTESRNVAERALESLYANGGRDLTPEGYQEALAKLRKANPTLAHQVERSLSPFLAEKVFPRRRVKWADTSQGLRARLALLPDNPHVSEDVRMARRVLGIPANQVKPGPSDPVWGTISSAIKDQRKVRKIAQGNLAGFWHQTHVQEARGIPAERAPDGLISKVMHKSAKASAHARLDGEDVPAWLRRPPSGPPPYDNSAAPLDWITGRVVERHCLPWHAALPLTFYILTENPDWLANIELFSVTISHPQYRPYGVQALHISIEGIDEFVTKEDWELLWKRHLKPYQQRLWRDRGAAPSGRRAVDVSRLRELMPLYRLMVTEKASVRDFISHYAEGGVEVGRELVDQESARRTLTRIETLLSPGRDPTMSQQCL
jgi:hypothetical protein